MGTRQVGTSVTHTGSVSPDRCAHHRSNSSQLTCPAPSLSIMAKSTCSAQTAAGAGAQCSAADGRMGQLLSARQQTRVLASQSAALVRTSKLSGGSISYSG